jgi:hypothetical protein
MDNAAPLPHLLLGKNFESMQFLQYDEIVHLLTEVCRDKMGLENGMMADHQVTASSVHDDDDERYGPAQARLNGDISWVPVTHSRNQWIQVLDC